MWLEEEFKCRTPDQINDIILAELPCLTNDSDAYKLVSEFMLHGPCGIEAKHTSCTNEGKCSKHYPKKFLAETVINEDGYHVYRRRDNKITAVKGKFTYENRHVVPHNRYLLLKYHAHINVEWCNRSKDIKYLFKYLNKGPDIATIAIQENVKVGANRECDQIMVIDEIKNYLNCRGAQSFTDLKMVNKINYATFKAACFAYGLLNDDKEWTHAIAEASIWAMAQQLRDLFVTFLLFCDVSRPLKLWEKNWVRLSEDILDKKRKHYKYPELNLSDEQVRNYCLLEIQDLLNTHGKYLTDYKDLPQPNPNLLTNLDNRLLKEALSFDANKSKVEHEKVHSMLNPEQRLIYEQIIEYVHNDKGQFCFIHGPGGTGKTFLYKTIIARLRSEQMIVLVVASSALDKTLQDILGYKNYARSNRIFGGMTVLLEGDFRQILPVIPNAKRPEKLIIEKKISIDGCWLWVMGNYQLKKESEDEPTWIEIPEEFLIKSWNSPIEQIVAETYPDFTLRQGDDEYLTERAILTPRNDDADAINENMFKKLGGALVTYNSADEICKASTYIADQHDLYPVEFLNSLNFQRMPPCPLLKKGTPNNAYSEYKPKSGFVQRDETHHH
nr:ATP-dependent DNA helicase PIF1-like [Tanacetum cinerariifolium]